MSLVDIVGQCVRVLSGTSIILKSSPVASLPVGTLKLSHVFPPDFHNLLCHCHEFISIIIFVFCQLIDWWGKRSLCRDGCRLSAASWNPGSIARDLHVTNVTKNTGSL